MSAFESTVLRPQTASLGSRRLPVAQPAGLAPSPAPGKPDLASLRATFADELAQLEQEIRSLALADARRIAEHELAAAQEKQRGELLAELDKQGLLQKQALERQQQQLAALIQALEAQRLQMTESFEPVVGRLALAAVMRLLGRHAVEPGLVAELAARAVEEYRLDSPLRIRVAEADHRGILAGSADPALKAMLYLDHDAAVGSCIIDFGAGQLDAGLETQLGAIKAALLGQGQEGGDRVGTL
ncbi:MAG TPA: FliH/SctL family protein [Pseudomonas sp.]|nr:FliH/SctL family protein [Pseudomonas sp.]